MANAEKIYYSAPCDLYRGFILGNKYKSCLSDVIDFAVYTQSYKNGHRDKNCKKFAEENLHVNLASPECSYRRGRKLFSELCDGQNPAFFSISLKMYWHFYNEETTEEERVAALAYLAVKSMIGKRDFIKTNMKLLCNRMDGRTRYRGQELSQEVAKYTNRYWSHKLLNTLYTKYGVVSYSGSSSHRMRGFYCSISLSMAELINQAEKARCEAKLQPKDPLREAKRKALEELGLFPGGG